MIQDLGAVHAADGGIVSADIVGYNTASLTGGNKGAVWQPCVHFHERWLLLGVAGLALKRKRA